MRLLQEKKTDPLLIFYLFIYIFAVKSQPLYHKNYYINTLPLSILIRKQLLSE